MHGPGGAGGDAAAHEQGACLSELKEVEMVALVPAFLKLSPPSRFYPCTTVAVSIKP